MLTHLIATNPLDLFLRLSLAGLLLLTLSTLLTSTLLRRSSAAARHLTWTATTLALLCLPAFALLPPAQPDLPPYLAPLPRLAPLPALELNPLPTATEPLSTPAAPRFTFHVFTSSRFLLSLYTLGLFASLTPLLLGPLLLRRLRNRATVVTAPTLLAALDDCRRTLDVAHPVTLLLSPSPTAMPLAFGLLRPHILLPADAPSWPPARLRLVLSHELAHIKRRDVLTLCLAQLARAVHWFNPLAYLAVSRMLTERERACDDLVLASTAARPSDYADTLLRLSTTLGTAPALLPAMPMSRGPSHLHTRLRAILNPAVNRSPLTRRLTIAALLLAPALALPLSCTRADKSQQPPIAGTQRAPGDAVDQYGWTRDTTKSAVNLRQIGQLILLYANDHDNHLPPDLGATLAYADRPTPADNARLFLDPRHDATVATPPTPDWVNAHTPYVYLGSPAVRLYDIPADPATGSSSTILVHSDPAHPYDHPKYGPLITALYADGHTEILRLDFAKQQIEASKKTLADTAKHPPRTDAAHPTPQQSTPGQSRAQRSAAPDSPSIPQSAIRNPQSPHPIPFDLGDSSFLPNDSITITQVLDVTPPAVTATRTYQVTGTYTLASHDAALLGAEITSSDPHSGKGGYARIAKGANQPFSLTFTLSGQGHPHVSFYPANGGQSFGGIYFGSGPTLLKHTAANAPSDDALNSPRPTTPR